jgi:hypothetical protein
MIGKRFIESGKIDLIPSGLGRYKLVLGVRSGNHKNCILRTS